jgi:hypothetical protein
VWVPVDIAAACVWIPVDIAAASRAGIERARITRFVAGRGSRPDRRAAELAADAAGLLRLQAPVCHAVAAGRRVQVWRVSCAADATASAAPPDSARTIREYRNSLIFAAALGPLRHEYPSKGMYMLWRSPGIRRSRA